MPHRFAGKSVLITGAAGGIGQATAVAFAQEGALLTLVDLHPDRLDETVGAVAAAGAAPLVVAADITRPSDAARMVAAAVDRHGRLDVAFNNAGIHHLGPLLADVEEADWDRVHNVCLKGMFFCMKHEIPAMLAGGGGAIVNTASVGGLQGAVGVSAYIAAKHGVVGLTRAAALEYAPQGIRVNAICPGATQTAMLADWLVSEEARTAVRSQHPIGRWAQPEEMARAVLFLASDDASFVVGAALPVDGGVSVQ